MTDRFKKKRKQAPVEYEAEHSPNMRGVFGLEDGNWFTTYGHTMAPPQNGEFVNLHYHQEMLATLNAEIEALRAQLPSGDLVKRQDVYAALCDTEWHWLGGDIALLKWDDVSDIVLNVKGL